MDQYISNSRHPKSILKVYRMYLLGSDDSSIKNAGISNSEIEKIIKFHECMLDGQKKFYAVGKKLGLPEHTSKRLWSMFCDWQAGNSISCADSSRKNRPHVASAYKLLLQGAEKDEMREARCTDTEIEKAKLFSQYADNDMLPVILSRKTGIPVSTVKKLQKMHKERSKLADMPNWTKQPEIKVRNGMMA